MPENGSEHEGPWISLRDVSFSYGRNPVLGAVSLTFQPGRHYAVTGPNGAGKSTMLDLVAGLKTPGSGTVEIMGQAPESRSANGRARLLAYAPQEATPGFSFTVRELVAMGRRPYLGRWGVMSPEDRTAVDSALRDLDLTALAGKSALALSGGEKRRCTVARALAQDTPVLLLDEPTAGLDVARALSLMALARRLAEEKGRLVVTVTHDLNLAAVYAHELVFVKHGAIEAAGPVESVFTESVLSRVYDAEARVRQDDFAGGPAVSFRQGLDKRSGRE